MIIHDRSTPLVNDAQDDEGTQCVRRQTIVEGAGIAMVTFEENERARATLNSIGDAVIGTDVRGRVTYLNAVAASMTGWSREQAAGMRLEEVLPIIDATTREAIQSPIALAMREDKIVTIGLNCVLIRRDGVEVAVEDSVAPIHDRRGEVIGAVIVFRDVSAARERSRRTSHMARHDSLTDLPNRAVFNERLIQSISLAQRHGQYPALLFLDVDRFKLVNDSLGHAVGDRLLQSVAKRLLACVRTSDTVCRQGGDEFVILLPEVTNPPDAALIAHKILLALGTPYSIEAHNLTLTASIGIVSYPDDGMDVETLMRNADSAMYYAKDCGRNNYQFFGSSNGNLLFEARGRRAYGSDNVLAEETDFLRRLQMNTSACDGELARKLERGA